MSSVLFYTSSLEKYSLAIFVNTAIFTCFKIQLYLKAVFYANFFYTVIMKSLCQLFE